MWGGLLAWLGQRSGRPWRVVNVSRSGARAAGPPWAGKFAADRFHPNDAGYADWVAAFTEALERRQSP
jgi:lysophospholipase L1-like esterase